MWRSGALIVNLLVIHVKLSTFCEGATGTTRTYKNALVKMPIEDGHVTVNINGQDQHLRLDTGSSQLRVMDGDWYESRYGEGACLTPNKGCFYCPQDALCDFDKDPTLTTSHSADGSTIKSLSRHGSLTLGSCRIDNFPFKVSREFSPKLKPPPRGYFGIAAPPQSLQGYPDGSSFLESLFRSGTITKQVYFVRALPTNNSKYITGELTLGYGIDKSMAGRKIGSFRFFHGPLSHQGFPTVRIVFVGLSNTGESPSGGEMYAHRYRQVFPSVLDTGSTALFLPLPTLLEDIVMELKRNLRAKGYEERVIASKYLLKDGKLAVYKNVVDALPVLNIRISDEGMSVLVQLHPRHYCQDARVPNSCQVAVAQTQST
ncbi:hypothetical protein FOZ62_027691 [Perkinsus olseni]|uniref:Peptidase A1 domain-containing protein n=1 Tax=Perkinsus olseni TaxID=32597 RepID=A0A7J6U531_PEROL|nr:hypothetical protein FOZ62_027691 [Perkinsus olseni]